MEALKRELERKRKALQADFGAQKMIKRGELERKQLAKLRQEEEEERARKQRLQREEQQRREQQQHLLQRDKVGKRGGAADGGAAGAAAGGGEGGGIRAGLGLGSGDGEDGGSGNGTGVAATAEAEAEAALARLQLPRAEVIRRLRMLKHPATLFGEDDAARLERLKHVIRTGDVDRESELLEGQRNDFLRDMAELGKGGAGGAGGASRAGRGGKKEGRKAEDKDGVSGGSSKRKDEERVGPEGGGHASEGREGAEAGSGGEGPGGEGEEEEEEEEEKDDIDYKRMKAAFEELCDEDKILVFFKRLLREWKAELDAKPEAERRTVKGKSAVATYKQCARYLDPMFRMCRRKQLYDDIREALLYMVDKCRARDYLAATDKYIKLAIGNAPWPIGVTMVGIHERSAREKIHTNSVAHIMNDETTRKYLQSVKRLITLCQRRYPAAPSRSIEFNSLANGSDLEALLQEEARKGEKQALLRLTAARRDRRDDEDGNDDGRGED